MKTKLFLTAVGSLAMTMAYSQIGNDPDFSDWDSDNNNKIEKNEYKLNANLFEEFDADNDNKLSQSEISDKLFELVDSDSDGNIDSIEWNQAQLMVNTNKDGKVDVKLNDWDSDRDSKISKVEFDNKLKMAFAKWDTEKDNSLSKTEFNNYTFGLMDLNNDGYISDNEFEKIKELTKDNEPFWKEWFE
jgi:Ca2+-binding EF-hand superfamily protein